MLFRVIALSSVAAGAVLVSRACVGQTPLSLIAAENLQPATALVARDQDEGTSSQSQPHLDAAPNPVIPTVPLRVVSPLPDLEKLGLDDRLFGQSGDRAALVSALNQSLRYLQTPQAQKAYRNYAVPGFTRQRVEQSLQRFRQLLLQAQSAAQLQAAVQQEFQFYESVGKAGQGNVQFTGYYVPVQRASRMKTAVYRYPLYKLPPDFASWSQPHPTRAQLEGKDGLQGAKSQLKGQELVYLADRLQAFLIHVQGSSKLHLTDGGTMAVGYAGATKHAYSSIGKELIKDGKFTAEELTLPKVMAYFQQHPQDLDVYLPRNHRFVFFRNTAGSPPLGSLGVPVTADRSIATDKRKMPPGALALINTQLPDRQLAAVPISRFVLDQDTGSAIIGPGRVDIFLGTGDVAGKRAGLVNHPGKLYYLLLK